jgi:hypothetical protein
MQGLELLVNGIVRLQPDFAENKAHSMRLYQLFRADEHIEVCALRVNLEQIDHRDTVSTDKVVDRVHLYLLELPGIRQSGLAGIQQAVQLVVTLKLDS